MRCAPTIPLRLQPTNIPDATDATRDEADITASLREIIARDEVPRVDDEGVTKASTAPTRRTQPTIAFFVIILLLVFLLSLRWRLFFIISALI